MAWDVPDDWHCYYETCGWCRTRYHASEGGCDCGGEEAANLTRSWLEDSGYEWDGDDWVKLLRSVVHTCRKSHEDGKVKVGQTYRSSTYRLICDDTGKSALLTTKSIIK
jgi:hypothetical protein